MTLSKIIFTILLSLLTMAVSCSSDTDSNEQANINITNTLNGLEVTLSGSAIDIDDTLVGLNINWGDASNIMKLIPN